MWFSAWWWKLRLITTRFDKNLAQCNIIYTNELLINGEMRMSRRWKKNLYILFLQLPDANYFFLKDICSNYNFSVGIFDSLFKIGGFCWCDAKKNMPPTSHFTCLFLRDNNFDNTILEVLKKIYSKKYSILKKNLEVYLFQNRHQQIENSTR